jgi:hypothetical protein
MTPMINFASIARHLWRVAEGECFQHTFRWARNIEAVDGCRPQITAQGQR